MHDDFPTASQPLPAGTPPLDRARAERWARDLPRWELREGELRRSDTLAHFQAALDWIVRVGAVAEAADHHPDIHLTSWNRVELVLSTHSIGGLSENDFVVAQAIDRLGPTA